MDVLNMNTMDLLNMNTTQDLPTAYLADRRVLILGSADLSSVAKAGAKVHNSKVSTSRL